MQLYYDISHQWCRSSNVGNERKCWFVHRYDYEGVDAGKAEKVMQTLLGKIGEITQVVQAALCPQSLMHALASCCMVIGGTVMTSHRDASSMMPSYEADRTAALVQEAPAAVI